METAVHFTKKVIRQPFDLVVDSLGTELNKAGFIVSGITDFQEDFKNKLKVDFKKFKIFTTYVPSFYYTVLNNASVYSMIAPCHINVVEVYPGIVEVIPINSMELLRISLKNDLYLHYEEEVERLFSKVLNALEGGSGNYPDLNTSWG